MKITKYALSAMILIGLVVPRAAHADELYQFNINAAGSPINPFSFSFTVPTFVASGDTPAFTPFSVTDGTHTWTIVKGLAAAGGNGCFAFGTSGSSLSGPPCTITVSSSPDGAFFVTVGAPLPTATGSYNLLSSSGAGIFDFPGGGYAVFPLSGTLDITTVSPVPEPSLLLLLSTGLLGLAGMSWRKKLPA